MGSVRDDFPFSLLKDVVINRETDFVARLGPGIRDKQTLLCEVGEKLAFPYWKSPNWDGFNDWISDLSWIPRTRVLMLHDGVPQLSRKDLLIYLETILSAMDTLAAEGRTLLAAFPERSRALTDALSGVKR